MIALTLFIINIALAVLISTGALEISWGWLALSMGVAVVWPVLRTAHIIRLYKRKYGYINDEDALEHYHRDLVEYANRRNRRS